MAPSSSSPSSDAIASVDPLTITTHPRWWAIGMGLIVYGVADLLLHRSFKFSIVAAAVAAVVAYLGMKYAQ